MPEFPEIFNLSNQMHDELIGKKIVEVEVNQEKCLNVSLDEFLNMTLDRTISSISSKGKWIFIKMETRDYLLLSLGMGGDVLYHQDIKSTPEKYQIKFIFSDNTFLTIGFWWFGYVHTAKEDSLSSHKLTASLGISPIDEYEFTLDGFLKLINGRRGGIKNFLTNQKYIAGIGNVYVQDILFKAKIHPLRKISDITQNERVTLFNAICESINEAVDLKGLAYENDLYGKKGKVREFLVGYKEGKSCPICNTTIEKIKTGSTASFICPNCQKL